MRSDSDLHEPPTNAEQSETGDDFRVSYESEKERRFQKARRGDPPSAGRHLYFIKICKGRGPVKIGRATNPLVRLATLQVASPYALKLIGILHGHGSFEAAFHRYLATDRMRGEWFGWSKKVETVIKLAIDGGDWQAKIAEREPRPADWDEWRIGSPLYAPNSHQG